MRYRLLVNASFYNPSEDGRSMCALTNRGVFGNCWLKSALSESGCFFPQPFRREGVCKHCHASWHAVIAESEIPDLAGYFFSRRAVPDYDVALEIQFENMSRWPAVLG